MWTNVEVFTLQFGVNFQICYWRQLANVLTTCENSCTKSLLFICRTQLQMECIEKRIKMVMHECNTRSRHSPIRMLMHSWNCLNECPPIHECNHFTDSAWTPKISMMQKNTPDTFWIQCDSIQFPNYKLQLKCNQNGHLEDWRRRYVFHVLRMVCTVCTMPWMDRAIEWNWNASYWIQC